MSDLLRLMARMFAIVFSFFAGCLAAGLAYAFLTRLVLPEDFGRFGDLEITVTLAIGVLGVASVFARALLLPAFAVIIIFEFFRRRDWLSYALASALLALGTGLPIFGHATPETPIEPTEMFTIRAACAIIGASAYWLLAGRNAGRWLPSERTGKAET